MDEFFQILHEARPEIVGGLVLAFLTFLGVLFRKWIKLFLYWLYNKIKEPKLKTFFNSDILLPKVWVDRSYDIERLAKLLKGKGREIPHVIEIQGLGGCAKSCFTRKFLDEKITKRLGYSFKVWFSFYKLKSTIDPFVHFLDFTLEKLDPNFKEYQEKNTERKRIKLEEVLRVKKILLVLDGFEIAQNSANPNLGKIQDEEFRKFLKSTCNLPKSQIIITTRINLSDLSESKGFENFKLSPWELSDFSKFLEQNRIKGSDEAKNNILSVLGSHPLTLTVFKFLIIEQYKGNLEGSQEIIEKLQHDISKPDYESSSAYEKQLYKLKVILKDVVSQWIEKELYLMKRLCSFYGEVYVENYTVLMSDKNDDQSAFEKLIERFVDLSLIGKGIRGNKPTINAHPMIKQVIYDLMDKDEKLKIHRELAQFFQNRPKPKAAKVLSDLDDLMEWFQQSIRGELFKEAFDIWEDEKLKDMLHFGGWFRAHLELIESLSKKAFEDPKDETINSEGRIKLKMTLGHTTRKLGRINEALGHFQDALDIASRENLSLYKYEASIEIAITYGFKGEFTNTFKYLPSKSLNMKSYYDGARLEWMGYAHAITGNFNDGIKTLNDAVFLCELRDDNRHLAPILTHFGDILILQGNYEAAKEKYKRSLDICKKMSYRDYEGDAIRGLGDYFRSVHSYKRSKKFYEQALSISSDLGYRFLRTEALLGLAKLSYTFGKNSDMILKNAKQGLEYALESEYFVQQVEAYLIIAQYYGKDHHEFEGLLNSAEGLLTKIKHTKLLLTLKEIKSGSYQYKGIRDSILKFWRR